MAHTASRAPRTTQAWVTVAVLLLGLSIAWMVGGMIAAQNDDSVVYVAAAVTACVVSVNILNNWRSGFYVFVVWLLVEDLVRKFMGNNMAVYFAKDVLVFITYMSFFAAVRRGRTQLFRFPFTVFLVLFVALGILQCFNPASPSFLYSILGFKLHFYYIPLAFVGYSLVRSEHDLRNFLAIITGLSGVIAGLGIIQAISGPSFLNPRVLAPDIRDLSTLYRYSPESHLLLYQPNSVFVSAGRFDSYLLLSWILGLGVAAFLLLRKLPGRALIFSSVALIAVALVMCGGRGVIVYAISSALVLAIGFLWGAPWRSGQTHKLLKTIWRTVFVGLASIIVISSLFPNEIGARWSYYSETMLPTSPGEQLTNRLQNYPLQEFEKALEEKGWVVGHGIGTASLGVQYVSRWLGQRPPEFGVESGYGNIVLEYGIFGLLFWWLWTAALLISVWRIVRKLKQTSYFPLAFSIFWFLFLLLYPLTYGTLNFYEDYVYNAFMWLLVGLVFRLPILAQRALEPGSLRISNEL